MTTFSSVLCYPLSPFAQGQVVHAVKDKLTDWVTFVANYYPEEIGTTIDVDTQVQGILDNKIDIYQEAE